MKAKIYVGAKKYALYIGRKIVEKTLEFLTLPARFVSKKVQDLKNLTMWGQSVQDGTPTPTAPIEIESVGDKSKNLFDKNDTSSYIAGYLESNGAIATNNGYTILLECKPNTTYTFSRKESSNRYRVGSTPRLKENIKVNTSGITLISSKRVDETVLIDTFTTTSDAKTLVVWFTNTSDLSVLQSQLNQIQLEEGSQATPYEPYGYKVPVMVGGKNLFDINNVYAHGYYNETGVWVLGESYNLLRVEAEPNTKYTLTYNADAINPNGKRLHAFDENMNWISQLIGVAEPKVDLNVTITTPANTKYLTFSYNTIASALENLQLELGTQATEYQPYIQPTTTNIYLPEPLRKIGEYADTLSVDGTEVTVTRNVGSITLDGSETITTPAGMIRILKVLSPSREKQSGWSYRGLSNYGICGSANATNIYIEVDQTQIWFGGGFNLTPDSLRTLLLQNNFISYYPVATPTIETYAIEQPINLPQGTLTIDTDTNVKPSKIILTGDIDNE